MHYRILVSLIALCAGSALSGALCQYIGFAIHSGSVWISPDSSASSGLPTVGAHGL